MFKSAKNFIKCLTTKKQDKIKFLQKKVYDYYYTIYSTKYYTNTQNGINIPDFILTSQVRKLAIARTTKELEKVIRECRVNQCFANAIK